MRTRYASRDKITGWMLCEGGIAGMVSSVCEERPGRRTARVYTEVVRGVKA